MAQTSYHYERVMRLGWRYRILKAASEGRCQRHGLGRRSVLSQKETLW